MPGGLPAIRDREYHGKGWLPLGVGVWNIRKMTWIPTIAMNGVVHKEKDAGSCIRNLIYLETTVASPGFTCPAFLFPEGKPGSWHAEFRQ